MNLNQLFLLLALALPALASEPVKPGSAQDFITNYEDYRNSGFAYQRLAAEHKIAIENEKKNIRLHEMNVELFKKKAISQDDLQTSLLRKNTSIAKTLMLDYQAKFFYTLQEKNALFLAHITGKEYKFEDVYDVYSRHWKAQCESYKYQVQHARAELDLQEYMLANERKLYAKHVTSLEALLEREQAYYSARETLASVTASYEICDKDIPTIEFMKNIKPK